MKALTLAKSKAALYIVAFKGFKMNINVRFFVLDYDLDEPDIVECSESEFLEHEGAITYERHTVRENGVSQICLTKGL